jgi:hypothetical protein
MSTKMEKVQKVQIGTNADLYELGTRYKSTIPLSIVLFVPAALYTIKRTIFGGNMPRRRASVQS